MPCCIYNLVVFPLASNPRLYKKHNTEIALIKLSGKQNISYKHHLGISVYVNSETIPYTVRLSLCIRVSFDNSAINVAEIFLGWHP